MSAQAHKYRPGKDGYVSDFTLFMDDLLAHHPEIIDDQHVGWRMYWDREVDLNELRKAEDENEPVDDHLGTISRQD